MEAMQAFNLPSKKQGRVQLTPTHNVALTLTLDVVDQLFGGVGRLHSAFVPFHWLLKWSSCSR
jgi:hypothetical protein